MSVTDGEPVAAPPAVEPAVPSGETPPAPAEPVAPAEPAAPEYLTRADLEQILRDRTPAPDDYYQPTPAAPEEPGVPELDFLTETDLNALTSVFGRMLDQRFQALEPIVAKEQDAAAEQWVNQTFDQLQVPAFGMWREGVLYGSAGFQRTDAQGRPVVHPSDAIRQSYEFLQRFAQSERAAERAAVLAEEEAKRNQLGAITGAPATPAGPAGLEAPYSDTDDEITVARRWRERQLLSS
jgi:hypothetical protein